MRLPVLASGVTGICLPVDACHLLQPGVQPRPRHVNISREKKGK